VQDGVGSKQRGFLSGLSKNTFIMSAGSLFADMSTEMLTPVLPIFLTQALGANGSVVGLVDGIAQAVRNVADGFSGPLSDKLKRRKSIALVGFGLAAIAKPLMGFSPVWEGVLGARILDRIGAGVRSAPRDALVASSVDDHHRGRGFGLESLGETAGAFLGPLLTVLLLYALATELRTVFYLAAIPGLLALLIVTFVVERTDGKPTSKRFVHPKNFPSTYWKFLMATAIFSIGNSSNSFLILQTQEIGASVLTTTLIYAGFNFVAALISYPAAYLSDKWGRKIILLGSYTVLVIVYAGFSVFESIGALMALFLLYGTYQGSFRPVGRAVASDLAPEQFRASGIGWYSATTGLFQLLASLIAGVLWDHVGHATVFIYAIVSGSAGVAALLVLVPTVRHGSRV